MNHPTESHSQTQIKLSATDPSNILALATPNESRGVANVTPRRGWHPRALLLSHLLAVLILASWLTDPLGDYWDAADLRIFRWLNDSLALGHWWQVSWAIANWRPFDLVASAAILLLAFYTIRTTPEERAIRGWISVAAVTLCALAVKGLVEAFVVRGGLNYLRASPTLALADTYRLSELVPWIRAKESSAWCFPSDHGVVLWVVVLYFAYCGRPAVVAAATMVAVVFCLPRLVSGGHWFTDIGVGSVVMALLTTAWFMATPLHDAVVDSTCWLLSPFLPERGIPTGASPVAAPNRRVA